MLSRTRSPTGFPLPSPDDFDYDAAMRRIAGLDDYYLVVGDAGYADVINSTGMVRTMSTVLTDFALGEPGSLRYAERKTTVQLEVLERILDRAQGRIDMVSMGEDLGTQIGPMISLRCTERVWRTADTDGGDRGGARVGHTPVRSISRRRLAGATSLAGRRLL